MNSCFIRDDGARGLIGDYLAQRSQRAQSSRPPCLRSLRSLRDEESPTCAGMTSACAGMTKPDEGDRLCPMPPAASSDDASWTSAGLARPEAVRAWQDWAAQTIAPIDVCVFDESVFAARWSSHGVGQLRLLRLEAPAQRVVHNGDGAGKATPSIQLVYARSGTLKTRMG